MSLTDLANVKKYLRIDSSDTTNDDLISMLILQVDAVFENECNRIFEKTIYTDEPHTINHKIFPNHYPIISVEKIERFYGVDNDVSSAETDNYRVFVSYIEMLDTKEVTMTNKLKYLNEEESNVNISYTAGYEVIPKDLELAAIQLVGLFYKESTDGRMGLKSMSEGSYSESYFSSYENDYPAFVRKMMDKYKKVRV